jgi:hypothetical protein
VKDMCYVQRAAFSFFFSGTSDNKCFLKSFFQEQVQKISAARLFKFGIPLSLSLSLPPPPSLSL